MLFNRLLPVAVLALAHAAVAAEEIRVDCGRTVGRIRALHGVNNGPLDNGENAKLGRWYAEAGFPVARLHDVRWPSPDAVDISAIFPLAHVDPDDPRNYLFAKTDDYLAAILAAKTKIVYRLGESIEPWSSYHTHPPRDMDLFARVCVNIIRHYNEGWGDGFHHGIEYWEIWNEPDNKQCWQGTQEDYFTLYEKVATAVEKHDPQLRVGGPALMQEAFTEKGWGRAFLDRCKERQLPLDFFSIHAYVSEPREIANLVRTARRELDARGFTKTEIHLNEWHYVVTWEGWRPGDPKKYVAVPDWFAQGVNGTSAAFSATVLMLLQDEPVDMANFYTADTNPWSMFGQFGIRTPVYHAFRAFNELAKHPKRVACELVADGEASQTETCAGLAEDGNAAVVLASTFGAEAGRREISVANLPWTGPTRIQALLVDDAHALEPIAATSAAAHPGKIRVTVELPADSVCLLTLAPERQ